MGGPNATQTQEWMTEFMRECSLDYYISLYGEHPFKCLVEAMFRKKFDRRTLYKDEVVEGVWYIDESSGCAFEKPIRYKIDDLNKIPSAYTNGFVDEFLDQDLIPMIETHRGCPFLCTYCDWGSAGLKKITQYSVKRVKEDIEYCRVRSKDERLMIDDANFGILGQRDLEIAEYLKNLRQDTGYPGKLIMTWSQAKSPVVLKIAGALSDMLMVTTSFQSMNKDVLRNIKRKNIPHEQFSKIVGFCRERGIDTYGELMLALPGETLESHFKAIRYLFDMRIDFININPLMLLEGSHLNSAEERSKYDMKTKYRPLENCYGLYERQAVIESQEMVVHTDTLNEQEYLLCRPVSWLIQMSWNLRRHEVVMKYLQSLGINPLDFVLTVIRNYQKADSKVRQIFCNFFADARSELFETREELLKFYSRPDELEKLRQGGFRKLNTHYSSRVSLECDKEFAEYYRNIALEMVKENGLNPEEHQDKIDDCCEFMYNRYVSFEDLKKLSTGEDTTKELVFKYDIAGWLSADNELLDSFYCPGTIGYLFWLDSEQKPILLEHMERFSGLSDEYQLRKLQEPYHGIHKKHLLYNIQKQPAKCFL
jgi:radical SAM superfamily enzyme YgiQ (UPF0313 family)